MAVEVHYNQDLKTLNREAASSFLDTISRLQQERTVTVGLCGGTSVKGFYDEIFPEISRRSLRLPNTHFFFADERLTRNYDETNYNTAKERFLMESILREFIPYKNIHPIFPLPTQDEINTYLARYFEEIKRVSQDQGKLELLVLSSGEDGHIASLFPNHPSIESEQDGFIYVERSPRNRISASPRLIQRADTVLLFFLGGRKRKAYDSFNSGSTTYNECPAKLVKECPNLHVFTDLV